MSRLLFAVCALATLLALTPSSPCAAQPAKKSPAEEAAAQVQLADKNLKVEVWAAEPLLANPVAFGFDEKGRCFVVETFRHTHGVPDTRGKPWRDDDLACRTVAERVAMLKKHNFPQYEKNSERLRLVWDSDGDGKADKDSVFSDGYNRYDDGIAAGVLARKGNVYFACVPDLYLLNDPKGENKATEKKSLATGFGIHVQFIGHDLHGLRMGPDGKLYFTVGDRGLNITTKEGKKLFNPDSGAVLRCDPDGSDLEMIHIGLRNPQELAFDDHGNLFTWDNNSDSGDRARWVLVVEGGDSGWRCGYQYGTEYHTPAVSQGNRGPWNTEKLWLPQWEGQAAYIVPALANFGNGPSGITHYPGIGLNDKYKDHFFLTDFTGGPGGNSAIWTLAVKPKGAAFEIVGGEPKKFITNMLPTDCEFGPDGAFYWSDWTTGWDKPGKGRILRVTDPEAMKNPAVAEAKKLLAEGFEKKTVAELTKLLEHPHQQVRQEAQFELVQNRALSPLADVAEKSKNRLARLHAVWGIGQLARHDDVAGRVLFRLLTDKDPEVKRAAIEHFGGKRYSTIGSEVTDHVVRAALTKLMADPDARVRAAAALTYGKIGKPFPEIGKPNGDLEYRMVLFDLLKANDDKDPYLRHAAVMGLFLSCVNANDMWKDLGRAGPKYDVPAVRMGMLLALRKFGSERVTEFLNDPEPRIVVEAARAAYDEGIPKTLPALAKLADKPNLPDAAAYRALAACAQLGNLEAVAKFAGRASEPDHTRAYALRLLANWPAPGRRDPITGLTITEQKRDAKTAAEALRPQGLAVFTGSDLVRREAAQTAVKLGIKEFAPLMAGLVKDAKNPMPVRVEALLAVDALKDPSTKELAALALESDDPKFRAAGLSVKAHIEPAAALKLIYVLLQNEKTSVIEQQNAFAVLARIGPTIEADKLLDSWLDSANAGKVPGELLLDVLDAAEVRTERAKAEKFALAVPLKPKVDKYRSAQSKRSDDQLAPYFESLAGGDVENGRAIVLNNSAVYCQRCHKLDGQGGEVGPALNGIAAEKERDRRYMLEAVVKPSAKIAKGFETVILVLNDDRTVTGVVKSEDKKAIRLLTAENKELVIPVDDVQTRRSATISAMPDDLHTKLSRRELRDVVEFLASLKEPLKK